MADSLFERLGGTEGITTITRDIIQRHLVNPDINVRFSESANIDFAQLEQRVIEFFTVGSGGPGEYSGRDMATAHANMNINERELISGMNDILGAVKAYGVTDDTYNDVLAILYSLKDEVMFK